MKPPKKVKVLWIDYDLKFSKRLRDDETGEMIWGYHDLLRKHICIDDSVCPELQRINVMHEILHGLGHMCGWELSERMIESLSHQWWTVLKNNPQLKEWFMHGNKADSK